MLVSLSFTQELLSWGADRSLRILYIRVAFVWKGLVSRVFHCKLFNTSADLTSYDEPVITLSVAYHTYSTLNKITQFWLVESSTINPKLYSVGVPIKFPWKRRNFVECTKNKKSHDLLVQFVNNRYSWFWKFSNCARLKARVILRTFKITRTY